MQGDKKPLSETIAEACEGLIFISETDAPFELFLGGKAKSVTTSSVRAAANRSPKDFVELFSAGEFSTRLTARDWHTATQKKRVMRFEKLEALLNENLEDLKVFRFGKIRIDIYVVGLDVNGEMVGVKTHAVET